MDLSVSCYFIEKPCRALLDWADEGVCPYVILGTYPYVIFG